MTVDAAAPAVGEFRWLGLEELEPNPWNPNEMDDETFEKEIESIRKFGMIDPLTVRKMDDGQWQILDGEHRWRALNALDFDRAPVWDLGEVADPVAKQITVVLNELRGTADRQKLGVLLKDLITSETTEELLSVLPYSEEAFKDLVDLPDFDWGELDKPTPTPGKGEAQWVERTFRMPPDAHKVIERAIEKMREIEGDDIQDWRALELICGEYLGGA